MNEILLTFDIEEFDIVKEFGGSILQEKEQDIIVNGTRSILSLLQEKSIEATFFITATFAEANRLLICDIAKCHEIASHSMSHSGFSGQDLLLSKKALEEISGKTVSGFRMPRMEKLDYLELERAGFSYDSSINPTYLPGRYNHLDKPTLPHSIGNITVFPSSVTPVLRIPLFWLSFKNFPLEVFFFMARNTLLRTGYLNLYFHNWEFGELEEVKLPAYIKKNSGAVMVKRLSTLIEKLSKLKNVRFSTIENYLKNASYPEMA